MKRMFLLLVIGYAFQANAAYSCSYITFKSQPTKPPYTEMKASIEQKREWLRLKYTLKDSILLERCFTGIVADSIMPYWYGTPWHFNGTTQIPGNGTIACGYFISTVLKDAGLHVNRVKMGQMDSEGIIHALAEKKDIKLFYEKPLPDVIAYLRQHGQGLYIIGLDCHVGFILVDTKGCWFIHSKWFGEKAVVREDAATSNILYYSTYRMVAKISNSRKLLQAWLYGGGL